jgi:hypothetical protein
MRSKALEMPSDFAKRPAFALAFLRVQERAQLPPYQLAVPETQCINATHKS